MSLRHIVVLLLIGAGLSACQSVKINPAPALSDADWPTDGHDAARDRYAPGAPSPPLEMLWDYDASAAFGPGSPLIYGESILLATRKGEIHVVDFETGDRQGFKSFGEALEGSPLIAGGTLFVSSSWGRRPLAAYDLRRGSTRWKVGGVPFETALLEAGDTIIGVDVEAVVRAHSKADGSEVWRTELGERISVQASPVMDERGRLIVATDRGELVALDTRSGELQWSTRLQAPVYNAPAVRGGLVIVPTTRGVLAAVDVASGRVVWSHDTGNRNTRFTSPAIGEGITLVGTSNAEVMAFDTADGSLLWTLELDDAVIAPPLLSDGVAYVGTMGEYLIALDPQTGRMSWQKELSGRVKSAMAARDGLLLVLTDRRHIEAYARVDREERMARAAGGRR